MKKGWGEETKNVGGFGGDLGVVVVVGGVEVNGMDFIGLDICGKCLVVGNDGWLIVVVIIIIVTVVGWGEWMKR